MTIRFTATLSVALLTLSMAAAPASAMDNNPMGTTTKAGLEADGYKCSVVSTGFWECTKGDSVYWCDAGSCQRKPLIVHPKTELDTLRLTTSGLLTTN